MASAFGPLSLNDLITLLRPFANCAEFLSQWTVTEFINPLLKYSFKRFNSAVQEMTSLPASSSQLGPLGAALSPAAPTAPATSVPSTQSDSTSQSLAQSSPAAHGAHAAEKFKHASFVLELSLCLKVIALKVRVLQSSNSAIVQAFTVFFHYYVEFIKLTKVNHFFLCSLTLFSGGVGKMGGAGCLGIRSTER